MRIDRMLAIALLVLAAGGVATARAQETPADPADALREEMGALSDEIAWLSDEVPAHVSAIVDAERAIERSRPGILDGESLAFAISLVGLLVFFLRKEGGLTTGRARRNALLVALVLTVIFHAPVWAQEAEAGEKPADPFVEQLEEVAELLDASAARRWIVALEALEGSDRLILSDLPSPASPLLVPLRVVRKDQAAGYLHTLAALRLMNGDREGALAALRDLGPRTAAAWASRDGRRQRWEESTGQPIRIDGTDLRWTKRSAIRIAPEEDEGDAILRSARYLVDNGAEADGIALVEAVVGLAKRSQVRLSSEQWAEVARWVRPLDSPELQGRIEELEIRDATTSERVSMLELAVARAEGARVDALMEALSGSSRLDGALLSEVQRLARAGDTALAKAILERAVVPSLRDPTDLIRLERFARERGIEDLTMPIVDRVVELSAGTLRAQVLVELEGLVADSDDVTARVLLERSIIPNVPRYEDLLRLARGADRRGFADVALLAVDRIFMLSGRARVNEAVTPFDNLPPVILALPLGDDPLSLGVAAGGLAESVGNTLGARDYYAAALEGPVAAVLKVGALELALNLQDIYIVRRYFERQGPREAARSLLRIERELRSRLPPAAVDPEPMDPRQAEIARLTRARDELVAQRDLLAQEHLTALTPVGELSSGVAKLLASADAPTDRLRRLERIAWWTEKRQSLHDGLLRLRGFVVPAAILAVWIGCLHIARARASTLGEPGRAGLAWYTFDRFSAALTASIVWIPAGLLVGAIVHGALTRRLRRALSRSE